MNIIADLVYELTVKRNKQIEEIIKDSIKSGYKYLAFTSKDRVEGSTYTTNLRYKGTYSLEEAEAYFRYETYNIVDLTNAEKLLMDNGYVL